MFEFLQSVFDTVMLAGVWRVSLQKIWAVVLLFTALIWGGGPEKIVIGIWIFATQVHSALTNFIIDDRMNDETWLGLDQGYLITESLLLIGFVTLALQANRQYVLWIAGFQVIACLAHVVRATSDDISIFAYLFMLVGAGWMQILCMTFGQIAYFRRKRGVYPDWRWQVHRPALAQSVS